MADDVFETFFPSKNYSPLSMVHEILLGSSSTLSAATAEKCVNVYKVRKLKEFYQESMTKLAPGMKAVNSGGGGTMLYTALVIPHGLRVDAIDNTSNDMVMSWIGPARVVISGAALQSTFLNAAPVPQKALDAIDTILVELQKKLSVRVFVHKRFSGQYFDVPIGIKLKWHRIAHMGSVIVPFGVKLTHGNAIGTADSHADLYGPTLIPDLAGSSDVYYGNVKAADAAATPHPPQAYTRDKTSLEAVDLTPFRDAVNLVRIDTTPKLTWQYHTNLRPLLVHILVSKKLGTSATEMIEESLPYKMDEELVTRAVMWWLIKKKGNHKFIVSMQANTKWRDTVNRAIASYTRLAMAV